MSDDARVHHILDPPVDWIAPVVERDAEQPAGFAHRGHHLASVRHLGGDRLLAENVLSSGGARHHQRVVRAVGRDDGDDVDRGVGNQLLGLSGGEGNPILLAQGLHVFRVEIGDAGHLHLGHVRENIEMTAARGAQADNTKSHR